MTMSMADGPVANLPQGQQAYAGYIDAGGIGITYPSIVSTFPNAHHLSISVHGNPADCADVESGAMSSWAGYNYGYASVSAVNGLISSYGRPSKLWTAHYTGTPHICSSQCWPGLVTVADGTQWTDHGGVWDQSLLADNFFGAASTSNSPSATTTQTVSLMSSVSSIPDWTSKLTKVFLGKNTPTPKLSRICSGTVQTATSTECTVALDNFSDQTGNNFVCRYQYQIYAEGSGAAGPPSGTRCIVAFPENESDYSPWVVCFVGWPLRIGVARNPLPVVSGSRGGNAALHSLLNALASLGFITDSTSA